MVFFNQIERIDWSSLDAYKDSQTGMLLRPEDVFQVEFVQEIMQQRSDSLDCEMLPMLSTSAMGSLFSKLVSVQNTSIHDMDPYDGNTVLKRLRKDTLVKMIIPQGLEVIPQNQLKKMWSMLIGS
ncbi:hypothetical protein H5410_032561 [Solanum commersonii]|uniref:Uncharacterized protein n=1 Tax=Solanum commersonii TaxID=4109 RepID=A0A9J5YN83_SOLCO|nr:hypothetical protein H5410_032561 [Solanum commersonii]